MTVQLTRKVASIEVDLDAAHGATTKPRCWATSPRFGAVDGTDGKCHYCSDGVIDTGIQSQVWGEWETCYPCAESQLATLHGLPVEKCSRPESVRRAARRSLNLLTQVDPWSLERLVEGWEQLGVAEVDRNPAQDAEELAAVQRELDDGETTA